MRLLAYGGTSHAERCRIGTWRDIKEGTLDDYNGLDEREYVIGVGFSKAAASDDVTTSSAAAVNASREASQSFVILRQLQNRDNRGGYAYTLLLDPGFEVWHAFAWNAAALMLALLDEPATHERLLARPETIDADRLGQMLRDATVRDATPRNTFTGDDHNNQDTQSAHPTTNAAKTTSARFANLLTAYAMRDFAADKPFAPLTLHAATLGLPTHPTLQEADEMLAQTLPCFRLGNGWLFGGSHVHGEVYRTQIVFDDVLANQSDAPEDSFARNEAAGAAIIAAWRAVLHDRELSPAIEPFALLPVSLWRERFGVEAATLNRQVMQLGELISASEKSTEMPPDTLEPLLRRALEIKSDELLAGEIDSALYRLAQTHEDGFDESLTRLLLQHTLAKLNARPRAVTTIDEDHANGASTNTTGTETISHDASSNEQRAQHSFFASVSSVPEAVSALDSVSASVAPLPAYALEWLARLNGSPQRAHLSIESKTLIAANISGVWSPLDCARRLLGGEKCDAPAPLDSVARENLQRDIQEMLVRDATDATPATAVAAPVFLTTNPPRLLGLLRLCGAFPLDLIESFARLTPTLGWNDAAHEWLQGWYTLNRTDIYEREAARLLTEGDLGDQVSSDEVRRFLAQPRNRALLHKALATLLFGNETDDDDARRRAEVRKRLAWLQRSAPIELMRNASCDTLDDVFENEAREAAFGQLYAAAPPELEPLFKLLSEKERTRVLKLLKDFDEEMFSRAACQVFRFARNESPLTARQTLTEQQRASHQVVMPTIKIMTATQATQMMKAGQAASARTDLYAHRPASRTLDQDTLDQDRSEARPVNLFSRAARLLRDWWSDEEPHQESPPDLDRESSEEQEPSVTASPDDVLETSFDKAIDNESHGEKLSQNDDLINDDALATLAAAPHYRLAMLCFIRRRNNKRLREQVAALIGADTNAQTVFTALPALIDAARDDDKPSQR